MRMMFLIKLIKLINTIGWRSCNQLSQWMVSNNRSPTRCYVLHNDTCQTRSRRRTNGRTDRQRDASLSVVSDRGVHPIGERTAMLHRNLTGWGLGKSPGSTNKYTKFGQLIIRKIIKIIATRCHILRLKFTKFDSRRLSVRSSICALMEFDTIRAQRLLLVVLHICTLLS